MAILILGLAVFLVSHLIPAYPGTKARLVSALGQMGYRGLFSVLSIVGLVLIVWGYAEARQAPTVLWYPPVWTKHLASLLMLFSFILLVATYIPGKIREKARHPMLAAIKLWAVAHLIANGTLADVVLFGAILAWAVFDRISLKRRGETGATGGPVMNDVLAVVLGIVAYGAVAFWLHELLIGVAPFA